MDPHFVPSVADSDDNEEDWEEIETTQAQPKMLEITLNPQPKVKGMKRKSGISYADRMLRLDCHKLHTTCLLANASIRNAWLNDDLLHARLLSLCPLKLQDAFAAIHKSRIPNPKQRGRMFETAISELTHWWSNSFFNNVTLEGHIRNYTFDEVGHVLERYRHYDLSKTDDTGVGAGGQDLVLSDHLDLDLDKLQDVLDEEGEYIKSPKSLMKHAVMRKGSRDVSAQLFTALCRALAIPTRLVASLQSMPWQTNIGRSTPRSKYTQKMSFSEREEEQEEVEEGKGTGKVKVAATSAERSDSENEHDEDEDMEEVEIPSISTVYDGKGKGKSKVMSLTGIGQRLNGSLAVGGEEGKEKTRSPIKFEKTRRSRSVSPSSSSSFVDTSRSDPKTTPPVFWTEVFSKADGKWFPVDPIRSIVNKRKVFDLSSTTNTFYRFDSSKKKRPLMLSQDNRLLYVLAFEEDGYAKDVTRRYAREYGNKVAKMQGGSGVVGGSATWWNHVLSLVRRPYRLHRDDIEDEELEMTQMLEGMPTTISGFKNHPIYVLSRHLKQNEAIYPPPPSTPELGKFRGEPVYPRSTVLSLKTAENWMRSEGRKIKMGEPPLKMVRVRAGTLNKLREIELVKQVVNDNRREGGGGGDSGGGGGDNGIMMQGLYARSQTEVYIPDPILDGIVPKNNYGNIDLYTPSMLPHGGVHLPYKGIAKIAKKLGFDFAEAVTSFEFKKRRAFPVLEGIVIAKENEEVLLEAFWESERMREEKARTKREEKVIKQWTRLIQGLKIRQRLQEQYGTLQQRVEQIYEGDLVQPDDVVQAFHLPKSHQQQQQQQQQQVPEPLPLSKDKVDFHTYDLDDDSQEVVGIDKNAHAIPRTMVELADHETSSFKRERGEESEDHGPVKKSRVATRRLRPRRSKKG